ncbi:MAG: PilX N-terminal domain-containing pilus assembly protein [Phycisphaerae bacterium]
MDRPRTKPKGFALILVMLLVAIAVVLGVSYASVASLKAAGSDNYANASRAKYLAESGLQHAMWIVQNNPNLLANSSAAAPLGPYYLDSTNDRYVFYGAADPLVPGRFVLTAKGIAGTVTQLASASVLRSAASTISFSRNMMVKMASTWLPGCLTVNSDLYVQGSLVNFARIHGNVAASGTLTDSLGLISGTKAPGTAGITMPTITRDSYKNYTLYGVACTKTDMTGAVFNSTDPLTNGGAVSATNPGGVVYLTKAVVSLPSNFNFTGTLVTDGDLILNGSNINLTAVDGFPAIMAKRILVAPNARVTVNGGVVVDNGIVPSASGSAGSVTTVNGPLIGNSSTGYDYYLTGTHTLNYNASRSQLLDMANPNGGVSTVTLQTWIK